MNTKVSFAINFILSANLTPSRDDYLFFQKKKEEKGKRNKKQFCALRRRGNPWTKETDLIHAHLSSNRDPEGEFSLQSHQTGEEKPQTLSGKKNVLSRFGSQARAGGGNSTCTTRDVD